MRKILHVWDQAGVACITARYQSRLFGHETKVIKRKGFDRFGILSHYGGEEHRALAGVQFLKTAEKISRDYDVVHVHDLYELVPKIRKRYPQKDVFLHYHGTRLRETPQEKRARYEESADGIFVSTPDLTKLVDSTYIPNPVDTELFAARTIEQNGRALCLMTQTETPEIIADLLKKHGISLDYDAQSRDQRPRKYQEMPGLLRSYECLIDLKYAGGMAIPAYSTTGLQALSLGLRVLNYDFNVVRGLPDMHKPENVARQLEDEYGMK